MADIYFICVCPRFQRELDSQAQEVVKRQDDSEASRKKLVELSREFKRTSTEVRKLYLGHTNLNICFSDRHAIKRDPGGRQKKKKKNLNLIIINAKFKQNHNTVT